MKHRSTLTLGVTALMLAAGPRYTLAAEPSTLPPPDHAGNVTYLSGGIGSDQSTEIKQQMVKYPLVLEFAGRTSGGNDYLADIPVQIADAHGHAVLSTITKGPFLLASLPDGHYSVTATYNGQAQRRSVDLRASSHVHAVFLWAM
nr:carboxypeptidase-like regulatory domain-containing protein [Burkholderia ambifaria]